MYSTRRTFSRWNRWTVLAWIPLLHLTAADPQRPGTVTFVVEGTTNSLTEAHAVVTPEDGLQLIALRDDRTQLRSLSISLPPRIGTFTSSNTPSLKVAFSLNVFSSSLEDHFGVRQGTSGGSIRVDLMKLGAPGELVEGTFSAVVANHFGKKLHLTNGWFSVPRK